MQHKNCKNCSSSFIVTDEDLKFYNKVSPVFNGRTYEIPPPTFCPACREQRRLAVRNERVFHRRICDQTKTPLLSLYAPSAGYRVFSKDAWYSDSWSGLDYGQEFDFNRPFFEQFAELNRAVPQLALFDQQENYNCDYANLISNNKNCYFIFAASENEDCFFTTYLRRCRDVCDSFFIFDSELCYECVDCYRGYNLKFSQYVENCRDSAHLYNCRSCSNCFGCVSLIGKEYHIFNTQYSKTSYEQKLNEILSSWSQEQITSTIADLLKHFPQKEYAGIGNENVSGDHISYSKNAKECFDCTQLEDCKFCVWLHESKDCYDCYAWGNTGELGYENQLCGNGFYKVLFCDSCCNNVSNLLYCRYCIGGNSNLFGCVGLKAQKYCILNKQYTKEEYERLVPKIIDHMRKTGEWGEFFPVSISPFGYNETVAQEYFPQTKERVLQNNWNWCEEIQITRGQETVSWEHVPENIEALPDNFHQQVLACVECARNYRLTGPELKFYQKMGISVPKVCFQCRYVKRRNLRNPRKLIDRFCEDCGVKIKTTFPLENPSLVYCEKCYHEAVI